MSQEHEKSVRRFYRQRESEQKQYLVNAGSSGFFVFLVVLIKNTEGR